MALHLITGKPGSQKSAYAMTLALKFIKEGRPVYFCNWRGLSSDFNVLDHFKDWASLPEGSAIFIDEIQEFTREVKTNAKTEELPPHFTALEKHRHLGYDFFIVTQHPVFIHTHLRRLVEDHRHHVRTKGFPFSTQRIWNYCCSTPEDPKEASASNGCQTVIFKPDKDVFNHYESTVLDTHSKFTIPPKLKFLSILLLIGFSIFIYTAYSSYNNLSSEKKLSSNSSQSSDTSLQSDLSPSSNSSFLNSSSEALFPSSDLLTQIEQLPPQKPVYDPSNPFMQYEYEYGSYSDVPYFVGCISDNKTCTCYTQQATRLTVSKSSCQAYLKNPTFDPYLSSRSSNSDSVPVDSSSLPTSFDSISPDP